MNRMSVWVHRLQLPRFARGSRLAAARASHAARSRLHHRGSRPPGPLRILAWTLSYPPESRGGSEVTLHDVLQRLGKRGFASRVIMPGNGSSYSLDGIEVIESDDHRVWREHAEWSDIVIAQLERQRPFVLAAAAGKPFVFWFHIGNVRRSSIAGRPALTVFTSNVSRDQHTWVDPATVVHPPVREGDYLVTPGTAATCINLSPAKGGELFFELARRVPDRDFLGVESWGAQVRPADLPDNCTVLPMQDDMRSVYRRTGVVLIPSVYEAYGRVAVEAAASGIPAIAHPTAGVREAMGEAILWADRDDPEAWVRHLADLEDPVYYAERSALARERFESLDPEGDLDALAERLRAIIAAGAH